mgnify:CR=1 FL=1
MKKRILSLLLVFVMCLTMLPTSSLAAGKVALKISAANASPSKGDTVTFSVAVGEVKNLTNMEFVIDVPEGLTYVEKSAKLADGLKETLMVAAADWTETTKKFTMYGDSAYTSATDTLIMTFDCKVNDDASGTLSVSVRDDLSISDIEYEEMDVTVVPATITIGGVTPPAHTCTLTKVPAKAATCTEDGNIEYYQCSDTTCGKLYKDAAGTQEITKADIVIKAGHTDLKLYPAKEPTCDSDGCVAYWFCTGCDNYYFDNNGAVGEKTTVEKVAIPATGHKWVLVVGGYEEGAPNHTIRCSVCGQKKDEAHADRPGDKSDKWESDKDNHWNVYGCGTIMNKAAHTWNAGVETTPATCTKAGVKTFTCTKCGYEKTEPIAVIAHKYEWKHDETNHWQECSVCHDIIDKAEHTYASHKCEDTATCTKAECGYVKPAGQHSWNDGEVTTPATCTTDGVKTYTCKVCSETKTEPIKASGHSLTKVEAVAATCTEGGNNEYYTCSVCKKVFKADKITETTVADETLAALGHKLTKTEAKAATCTESGNSEYYTCGNCGKFFSDADGKTEIVKDSWVIKALDHDFTGAWVNTDAAGHYHKCSRCDATDTVVKHTFNGKPCNEEDKCTVCGYVKAAGVHAWGTAEYKWGDDNMSCTATVKCTNCEAVETDVAFIGISTTPATCTVDGKTVYTATFSSELFTTQTKEVTIDKLGHTYGAPVWSWSEDGKTATATFTCTREGCTAETTGHAQTVTATVSGKQNVAPTCTDKGTTTYTAKVTFETKDYTDTKDVQDIKALGHKLTKTAAKAATCTEPGNKEYYTCGTCGKFFSDKDGKNEIAKDSWVIDALGHKMTKTEAVTPTCAAGGNNEYYTCSVCNKVFKDEQGNTLTTVAAETLAKDPANHTGGKELRGAVAASCMTAGRTDDTYCKGCGKLTKAGDLIPPTGKHNYKDGVCTTCGNKQPADNATIKAAIEDFISDVVDAAKELEKKIEDATDVNTKKILEKLKGFVSGSSRSKLQAVYSVTMSLDNTALKDGKTLADGQNVTIAISEETYNALRSGAKIVESYLDKDGNAQTREINATLKQVGGGYTVTFASDKTAVYGLMTKTSSGGSSGSGSSYTSGQSFTTDLPADSINRVTVNGKKLDSKYYTVSSNGSGSIVTLTDAYLATLKAGKYTVKIENKTHVSTGTFTIKADGTLSSPKTADAGIALYAMLAVSSLMGTAVVSKKRRKA